MADSSTAYFFDFGKATKPGASNEPQQIRHAPHPNTRPERLSPYTPAAR